MKNLKDFNETLRQYNGLTARTKKTPTAENKELLQDCLIRLADQAQVLLDDKTIS